MFSGKQFVPIGALRHKIIIEQNTATDDPDFGGQTPENWVAVAEPYAEIRPFNAAEKFRYDQVDSSVSHMVTIRYRTDVTADMRVKFGSRIFYIKGPAINVEEKNQWLQLVCEEK